MNKMLHFTFKEKRNKFVEVIVEPDLLRFY